MLTAVVDKNGTPGMPTYNIRKVRKLLKSGKAKIYCHKPMFTVQMLDKEWECSQEVELCVDAGYQHIGVSVKSEKHEFVHAQYDLLIDEKQRHDDRRKYRRVRRNRLRYRKPKVMQTMEEEWLAPSIQNKLDRHIDICKMYKKVLPITSVVIEVGSFDTQLIQAIEEGKPLPEGVDYQHGPRYLTESLRDAVFYRDNHTCLVCGCSDVPLRVHHIGFWKTPSDHTDRMSNLATVCTNCHTAANHKPDGKLYGWKPDIKPLTGAAFMNIVRWRLLEKLKEEFKEVHATYGSMTKAVRKELNIEKTHANDAYCMGRFQPKNKAKQRLFKKVRRNNRILEKFYDAKYIDIRDGKTKKGADLSCGRTNRSERRDGPNNERICRGRKISKGRRQIRRKRYPLQPGTIVIYKDEKAVVKGVQNHGAYVSIATSDARRTAVKTTEVKKLYCAQGWQEQKDSM